jgi:hypothetical protein
MPARKSWASRIIGLRLVRPIAVSTSISTLASEPCTISTSTGSAPAPASSVRWPKGNSVGARRDPVGDGAPAPVPGEVALMPGSSSR